MRKWIIGKPDHVLSNRLARQCGLSELCMSVLVSRGIDTAEKAQEFFNYSEESDSPLSDPFLLPDMDKAVDIITNAVNDGKKICIYGDYDCDGVTATTLLYTYLMNMGADITYYINMRSEGYGMNCDAVRRLAEDGVELIITVDNGISAVEEVRLAKELGMDVVVTDHHQPSEILPEADALIDPHLKSCQAPFRDLCGCAVALKLMAAMDGGIYDIVMEQCSDLCAVATIADVVPLKSENREIVKAGLRYLENTENEGLKALISSAGIKPPYNSTSAAFGISPRINASGRFGSASDAVELFLAEDPDTAAELANRLEQLNTQRKEAENAVMADIMRMLAENPAPLFNRVIVLYGKGWHHGVIGICAARLVEKTGKPVFLLSDDGEFARGSARAAEGLSVFEALSYCAEVLDKFGGHKGAGGFSLKEENIPEFDRLLQKYAAEQNFVPVYPVHADKVISPEELTVENISSLSALEPYGEGNSQPLFLLHGAVLTDIMPLSGGAHTKIKLKYGKTEVIGLMFRQVTAEFTYNKGDVLDVLACAELNTYNGRTSVNLRIADLRLVGISQQKYFAAREAYESYRRGEVPDKRLASRIIPRREDLAAVYRALPQDGSPVSYDLLFGRLKDTDMSCCMMRAAIDVFCELGLASQDIFMGNVKIIKGAPKADIEKSLTLKKLREAFT